MEVKYVKFKQECLEWVQNDNAFVKFWGIFVYF